VLGEIRTTNHNEGEMFCRRARRCGLPYRPRWPGGIRFGALLRNRPAGPPAATAATLFASFPIRGDCQITGSIYFSKRSTRFKSPDCCSGARGKLFCYNFIYARVAELADALGSGPSSRKGVEVRVLSRAPTYFCTPAITTSATANFFKANRGMTLPLPAGMAIARRKSGGG
jgi:hypothetical protein